MSKNYIFAFKYEKKYKFEFRGKTKSLFQIDKFTTILLSYNLFFLKMNTQDRAIQAFEESEYGEILKKQIRFAPFKPDHISNDEWERTLGADVNNLKHMKLMKGLCRSFSKTEGLSKEDTELLVLVASVHDWAEAIVGDIPAPLKTEQDKETEKKHLNELLEEFKVENRDRILKILFDINDPLHEKFSLFEKVGYFRTAVIAWEKSQTTQDNKLCLRLTELAKKVLIKQILCFINRQNFSPIIKNILISKKNTLMKITDFLLTQQETTLEELEKLKDVQKYFKTK
jgi:hypothetical protein